METKKDVIDLGVLAKHLLSKKKLFYKVWAVTFVLSCFWVLPKPRLYDASVVLAPEMSGEGLAGGLSSLASNFGVDIGGGSNDAIYPMLYPDVVSSNDFIVSLFDLPVKSIDGEINTDLYTYLDKYQKTAFYMVPVNWTKKQIGNLFPKKEWAPSGKKQSGIDPFQMTRRQTDLVKLLKSYVNCSVDKKTEVITIEVRTQDPLVSAQMADSVASRLQKYITNYRTSKARGDVEYYTKLLTENKAEYARLRKAYVGYADSHTDISLPSSQAKQDDLENAMQVKFNAVNLLEAQLEAAKAKVQETTPAFTTLQSSTVPLKPNAPKRMFFIAGMMIFASFVTAFWTSRKILITVG